MEATTSIASLRIKILVGKYLEEAEIEDTAEPAVLRCSQIFLNVVKSGLAQRCLVDVGRTRSTQRGIVGS